MKYFTLLIGATIGFSISNTFSDAHFIGWILGGILGFIGYILPDFVKYTKSSPKDLLKFHAESHDPRISRSTSRRELQVFIQQLSEGGLIRSFNPLSLEVRVRQEQWKNLSDAEKQVFSKILTQASKLEIKSSTVMSIPNQKEVDVFSF